MRAPSPTVKPPRRMPTKRRQQVAMKALELIAAEAQKKAKTMTAEEVEELKAKLSSELPAAMQQILAECAKENWSDTSRKCVIDAKDLAQATKCQ